MNKIIKSFGICVKQCEIQNRNTNERAQLIQGELIRILQVNGNESDKIVVKLYNSEDNTFKSDLFECAITNVDYVVQDLWLYLIGTPEKQVRLRIYNERNLVLQLKCGTEITIKSYENDEIANIKGVVQLIDTVDEIGVGYFIGVRLNDTTTDRATIISLYKKQFNHSKAMLLFRIDQLLDNLIDINAKDNALESGANYTNAKLNVNAPSFEICNKVDVSADYQLPKYSRTSETSLVTDPSRIESNISMASMERGSSNVDTCILPQISSVDCGASKPNASIDKEKCVLLKSNGSLSDSELQRVTVNEIKNPSVSFPITDDFPSCAQITNLPNNEKEAFLNKDQSVVIKKKNARYNGIKTKNKLPVGFDASNINSEQVRKNKPNCNICNCPFNEDMLMLKCKHNICGECFGIKGTSLSSNSRVNCPFSQCKYQLRRFEFVQLSKILEIRDNRQPDNKCNNSDEKTDKCEDGFHISKLDADILFQCPLCKINNGVHCKAIHDEMICMVKKLRNLIESFISNASEPNESKQILEGSGVPDNIETLTKCIRKACDGYWFISQSEKSSLYKCPICKLYNCIKCKAIHQNQTCEEYKAAAQQKPIPNSKPDLGYKSPNVRSNPRFQKLNISNRNAGAGLSGNVNIKWSCSHCTYDNFNPGRFCYMCRKANVSK